jgi:diguanylate cyclase (GGDEF)-like protein
MVMASWPAASGRGRRLNPVESVHRRAEAALRRAMRRAIRIIPVVAAMGAGLDAIHLSLRYGEAGRPIALAELAGAAAVTAACLILGVRLGRNHVAAFASLATLLLVTMVHARFTPEMDAGAGTGYLAVIVVGSALFVPWSLRWHLAWLVTAIALVMAALLGASPAEIPLATSQLMVGLLAALVSAIGHRLVHFRTRRMLEQHFELRRMTGLLRRQEHAVEDLNRELVRTARVDTLTGIGNRRALDEAILALAGTRLAAVLLDLDHFKAFNDRNGHLSGDEALARVGAILRQAVRREDMVFRYGGEEFLILVPGADRETAAALAERVRTAVQDDPSGSPWGLTVSAGVAVADRFSAGSPLGLLRRADSALYQAKRAGRNRVVLDDPAGLALDAPLGA